MRRPLIAREIITSSWICSVRLRMQHARDSGTIAQQFSRPDFAEVLRTAWEECRAGTPADATVELVRRAISSVIHRHNLPPTTGTEWTSVTRREALHEFFADNEGGRSLIGVAHASSDERHFWNQLRQRVYWWFSDDSRTTPIVKHRRRLRTALKRLGDAVIESRTGWALHAAEAPAPWDGQLDTVTEAADRVALDPPPWSATTEREGPPTSGRSYRELVMAILSAANATVSFDDLTWLAARRLGIGRHQDAALPRDDESGAVRSTLVNPGEELVAATLAEEIWEELRDRQKHVIPYLDPDITADAALEAIGVGHGGRSSIAAAMKSVRELLNVTLDGLPREEALAIAAELLRLHAQWTGQRP